MTFSGVDSAIGSANHTTTGRGRGVLDAPLYSYPSAISSARAGARNAAPLTYSPYLGSGSGSTDTAWASTSSSGSASFNSSESLSGVPFSGNSVVPHPQLLLQQYGQLESHASFIPPLESQSYGNSPVSFPSNPIWGDDLGLDDAGDPGGIADFGFSHGPPISHSGSFVDDSTASPDVSGHSTEVNFNGTAGFANSAPMSASSGTSAPVSPVSSRDQRESKRAKRLGTVDDSGAYVDATAATRRHSISTSASSSSRGGAKGKHKRELRSASHTSKNKQERPDDTTEGQKSRNSHNLVEKQYRNRLNAQFEDLLHVLPESSWTTGPGPDGVGASGGSNSEKKRVSKGEVLDLARQRIMFLEEENKKIERENSDLRRRSFS